MKRYLGDWAEEGWDGKIGYERMLADFEIGAETVRDDDVLLAAYGYKDYEGAALVIVQRGGEVYEVHGSHCSCYGLEGQWEEEATSWAALKERFFGEQADAYFGEVLGDEVMAALRALTLARLEMTK